MPLSHSPTSSAGKKNIFQKLFGKVKSAIAALGILSAPAMAQTGNTPSPEPKIPSIEERLAFAQNMNLESIKSIQDLEKTIENTWSQLKNTPKAPKELRDKYGHITTEGLTWIESRLPEEHLSLIKKYRDLQKELQKIDTKNPRWGVLEYSLTALAGLMIGLIGYTLGKTSQKDIKKLQEAYDAALKLIHTQNTSAEEKAPEGQTIEDAKASNTSKEIEEKVDDAPSKVRESSLAHSPEPTDNIEVTPLPDLSRMTEAQLRALRAEKTIIATNILNIAGKQDDAAEIKAQIDTIDDVLSKIAPQKEKTGTFPTIDTSFLSHPDFGTVYQTLVTDLSSATPSSEAKKLQESIEKLSDTTGTPIENARRLGILSQYFITFVRSKGMPETELINLLRGLKRSFEGQKYSFGNIPVIGQSVDILKMTFGRDSTTPQRIVKKVLSLSVIGHDEKYGSNYIYEKAKVELQ